ncbi:MAG TPA: M56 family metallopeptidase [Gemmatimonadaceae bacterium]|nr:M56 family metallopeptidase [Gemmatimonadaceae bacterium]
MIAEWMIRTLMTTALLAAAASLADAIVRLFGRQRRRVWAGVLALALVLPVAGGLAPPRVTGVFGLLHVIPLGGFASRLLHPGAPLLSAIAVRRGDARPAGMAIDQALITLWIMSSMTVLSLLAVAMVRLRGAAGRCTRVSLEGVDILVADTMGPAVVGVGRPMIVLPQWAVRLAAQDRRLILRHEREHLAAGDARLLAGAALPLVLMPWNLPLWWLHRQLRQAIEIDCDARVLASGADVRAYAEVLLRTAARGGSRSFLSPALIDHTSHLQRRILAMTTTVSQKHRLARALGLTGALVLVGLAACDAANKTAGVAASAGDAAMPAEKVHMILVTGASTDSTSGDQTWTDSAGRVIGHFHHLSFALQTAAGRTQSTTMDGQMEITLDSISR